MNTNVAAETGQALPNSKPLLTSCAACGHIISAKAYACPSCGHPNEAQINDVASPERTSLKAIDPVPNAGAPAALPSGEWWFWTSLALGLVVVLALITSGTMRGWIQSLSASSSSGPVYAVAPPASAEALAALNALKKLQAKTEVGVSYRDYSPAVADARFAVKQFLDTPRAGSEAISAALASALAAYEDAGELWNLEIQFGQPFVQCEGALSEKVICDKYPELFKDERQPYRIRSFVRKLFSEASRRLNEADAAR